MSISTSIRLLFVDDEPRIPQMAARTLRPRGIHVDACGNATEFLKAVASHEHDAMLIDWNLRSCEGTTLCADLRGRGETRPIAIVSGKLDVDHGRTLAMASGADAYIEKPMDTDELARQVHALVRNQGRPDVTATGRKFECASARGPLLSIELHDDCVILTNVIVRLRGKELAMLRALLGREGDVVSKAELARIVWDARSTPATSVVETTMSRLRVGLGAAAHIIETVQGGYVIRASVRVSSA